MNKKFLIAGIVAIALIFIVLILIVVLSNTHPVVQVPLNNTVVSTAPSESTAPVDNKTNTVDPREKIEGEIEYYDLEDGNSIPIPPTFSYVEGDVDSGVVIEDKAGNQFVWVPVPIFEKYTRFLFERNGNQDNDELAESLDDDADYDSSYDDSIRNYKGFYIARYEAGMISESQPCVSKEGVMPWTSVTWQQAKDHAHDMYLENDAFQTDLVNSYAWDTMCLWLRDCGYNIDDSTEYGNYQNGKENITATVECGSNTNWVTNNIYDLAGNVWEFSTESQTFLSHGNYESVHMGRGGGNWNNGDEYPISSRFLSDDDGSNIGVGFRVVLYLK